jgi:hypothetical protein
VWHVAQVLSDVPAMPERVLKLAVPVAPEHVRQRLTNRCARRHPLREHRFGVRDVKGRHHRRAPRTGTLNGTQFLQGLIPNCLSLQ